MLILIRITSLTLLVCLISASYSWGRSKSIAEYEGDDPGFAASRTRVDDLEKLGRSGSTSKVTRKHASRHLRMFQKNNAAPKASPEGDAASFIRTISTNDLKQLAGVQNVVYTKERFHLPGQGGLFIQSILSHKDYAKANSGASADGTQTQGLFAKIWLWWISLWSPQPKTVPTS